MLAVPLSLLLYFERIPYSAFKSVTDVILASLLPYSLATLQCVIPVSLEVYWLFEGRYRLTILLSAYSVDYALLSLRLRVWTRRINYNTSRVPFYYDPCDLIIRHSDIIYIGCATKITSNIKNIKNKEICYYEHFAWLTWFIK